MVIKLIIYGVLALAALTMLGLFPQDTFMRLWEQAFVFVFKAAIFAAIPGGFLLAIYLKLQGGTS